MSGARHPNIGIIQDLSTVLSISRVECLALLNSARIPTKIINGTETYSRRHLVDAFRSGVVRWEPDDPKSSTATKYTLAESGELYRASLPPDGSPPF